MAILDGPEKLASQRLYIIGGASPNKTRGLLGCFLFICANLSVHGWSNGKQNSGLQHFITESRFLFAQISFIYPQLPRKQKNKTTQSFTLNKLTEI